MINFRFAKLMKDKKINKEFNTKYYANSLLIYFIEFESSFFKIDVIISVFKDKIEDLLNTLFNIILIIAQLLVNSV